MRDGDHFDARTMRAVDGHGGGRSRRRRRRHDAILRTHKPPTPSSPPDICAHVRRRILIRRAMSTPPMTPTPRLRRRFAAAAGDHEALDALDAVDGHRSPPCESTQAKRDGHDKMPATPPAPPMMPVTRRSCEEPPPMPSIRRFNADSASFVSLRGGAGVAALSWFPRDTGCRRRAAFPPPMASRLRLKKVDDTRRPPRADGARCSSSAPSIVPRCRRMAAARHDAGDASPAAHRASAPPTLDAGTRRRPRPRGLSPRA